MAAHVTFIWWCSSSIMSQFWVETPWSEFNWLRLAMVVFYYSLVEDFVYELLRLFQIE
jgi:hypothetical protein